MLRTEASLPSPFPLLFIVLTGGALSGFHALIAAGPTVRQLRHQRDATMISYGSIAIEGLLALLVLIVLAAGFTTVNDISQIDRRRLEFRTDGPTQGALIDLRTIVLVPKDHPWKPPESP